MDGKRLFLGSLPLINEGSGAPKVSPRVTFTERLALNVTDGVHRGWREYQVHLTDIQCPPQHHNIQQHARNHRTCLQGLIVRIQWNGGGLSRRVGVHTHLPCAGCITLRPGWMIGIAVRCATHPGDDNRWLHRIMPQRRHRCSLSLMVILSRSFLHPSGHKSVRNPSVVNG